MTFMTNLTPEQQARQDSARHGDGTFGEQHRSDPAMSIGHGVPPANTIYDVTVDGVVLETSAAGSGIDGSLAVARQFANELTNSAHRPSIAIYSRAADESDAGRSRIPYVPSSNGRVVGYHLGDAYAVEELDEQGISLSQLEDVVVEQYIEQPDGEGSLGGVLTALSALDTPPFEVYARRNDDGSRDVTVDVLNNFLWDAELHFSDESDGIDPDDGLTPAERYEAWLNEHSGTVEEVFRERFNADIDVTETWENATVSLGVNVPYERFTERLVTEDCWNAMSKFLNETDPGTYGSTYVMAEVSRRVEAKQEADSAKETH